MTSVILKWINEDKSDVKIDADEYGSVLLFEKINEAKKYGAKKYGFKIIGYDNLGYPICDNGNVCNYQIVEI